jgi:hypothetical protein
MTSHFDKLRDIQSTVISKAKGFQLEMINFVFASEAYENAFRGRLK